MDNHISEKASTPNPELLAQFENAAKTGDTLTIKNLISMGVDVNTLFSRERTALMYAAKNGHNATVDALIQAGANVHLLAEREGYMWSRKDIEQATETIFNGMQDVTLTLLFRKIINLPATTKFTQEHAKKFFESSINGNNALLYAVDGEHIKVAFQLLNMMSEKGKEESTTLVKDHPTRPVKLKKVMDEYNNYISEFENKITKPFFEALIADRDLPNELWTNYIFPFIAHITSPKWYHPRIEQDLASLFSKMFISHDEVSMTIPKPLIFSAANILNEPAELKDNNEPAEQPKRSPNHS